MKVALITGASRGIGRACAVRLAADGYTVVINYSHSEAEALAALEEIRAAGGDGMICKADVSNPEEVREMVTLVDKTYGQIDLLVNNAGVVKDEYLLMMNPDTLDKCLSLNVKGYFFCAQAVALKMFRKKRGVILNMSSVSGELALAGQSVYSATKGAVNSMTRVLAKELSPKGIRVNAIAPGFFITEQNRTLLTNPDGTYTKRGNDVITQTPFGRMGDPEELCGTIHYLMSDAAKFVTGTVAVVDGGFNVFAM